MRSLPRRHDRSADAARRYTKEENALTLDKLFHYAIAWCPVVARWPHLLESRNSWGAAHELGHALIEPRWRWVFESYERCSLGVCRCDETRPCNAYEAAAMYISRALLRAAGNEFLADLEINDTPDYDWLERDDFKRAKALLKRKGLWPIPRTRRSLEAALKRRLGKPRGGPLKRQKLQPRDPLRAFAEAILGTAVA